MRLTETFKTAKKAKRAASRIKEDLIEEGESLREKMIEETRIKTKEMMNRKMTDLDKALTDAEKRLEKEINSFSDKIKEKFI